MLEIFIFGGKYLYIYTGLIEHAKTDDELAFVLSHEIGHSILKHHLRQSLDSSLALIKTVAGLVSIFSKYDKQAMAVSKVFTSSYSRADEEEADAFGVIAAHKAGYNPVHGVDFLTRMERMERATKQKITALMGELKAEYEQAQRQCVEWKSRPEYYTSGYSGSCQEADRKYSQYLQLERKVEAQRINQISRDHPSNRNRISAIVALSDFLDGKRDLDSLEHFQQTYRVIMALQENNSQFIDFYE